MKIKNRLAGIVRNLPKPLNIIACRCLSDAGIMSSWNKSYSKIGCPQHILSGLFTGMAYAPIAHGSPLMPKLLGTYENEINVFVSEAIADCPDIVVDIGSAEGYYAVGLAVALVNATIYAFDINPLANHHLLHNARRNGVRGRVNVGQDCDSNALQSILMNSARPLVISDCEGYELDILDPSKVPLLTRCRMIVEVHEQQSGMSAKELLFHRFQNTHSIDTVSSVERTAADWPEIVRNICFSNKEKAHALDEGRSPQNWMAFVPKN